MVNLILSVILGTLALILCLPQILRLYRTRDSAGISEAALYNGAFNYVAWNAIFIAGGEIFIILQNLLGTLLWFTLTAFVVILRKRMDRTALLVAGTWGLCLLASGIVSLTALSYILSFSVLVTYTPSVWAAWREPSIVGISATTWTLYLLNGLTWVTWGTFNGNLALLFYGLFSAGAALGILLAIVFRREARLKLYAPAY